MISVEVLQGRPALESIAPEWETLVGNSFTTAFSQPAWYAAWLDAFETQKIAFVTARAGNRLVGVLPLARFRTDARGLYFTEVAPIARGDYQPPIVAPEYATEALPAMLDAALEHFGRRGTFWWPNIPVTDPSLDLLRQYFSARKMPFVEDREVAPRLRLEEPISQRPKSSGARVTALTFAGSASASRRRARFPCGGLQPWLKPNPCYRISSASTTKSG